MAWWSPDPRAVLELDQFHISRRLRRTVLSHRFGVTCNVDFRSVIEGCATADDRHGATWLTPGMIDAYCEMHRLGHAHSVETWLEDQLVGGTYGIAIGGLFAAESKFYRVRDASKVALVHLVNHLRSRGYQLLDVQQWTPHTGRMGATNIPRRQYLHRLATVIKLPVTFGTTLEAGATDVRNS
jgi:leucyl/phenylalanyl-tRNA--protein transferase